MEENVNEITINGIKYFREGTVNKVADSVDGLPCVVIRAESAGVFYGYLKEEKDGRVVLKQSRRVFYWSGAASLSQLAIDGTSKPRDCKFPEAITEHTILKVIEIIPLTDKAKKSLDGVPVWKM